MAEQRTDLQNSRGKVLVVDDEQSMRDLLRLHLANDGYEVSLAEDAIVAGHLILKDRPNLILVDVEMPYMNGYEFVAALKGDPGTRDIPIVFLTTDDNVASQAKKLGAAAYLQKPVMANRLLEVVALFVAS
jgi:CheY-like chemotaxis protein